MNAVIAVPSTFPGGLQAAVSEHFGKCDVFTLVTIRDGRVDNTTLVRTPPHGDGGCLVPVGLLASRGATAIIAQGMGKRPLMGFLEAGVQPYAAADCRTVGAAVDAFLRQQLQPFGPNLVCGCEH